MKLLLHRYAGGAGLLSKIAVIAVGGRFFSSSAAPQPTSCSSCLLPYIKDAPSQAQILQHPAMALNGKFRESPTIQPEP